MATNITKLTGKWFGASTPAYKRVALKPDTTLKEGFTSVRDGWIVGDYVIEVDVEKLAHAIGEKALKSKHHVAKLQGGAVILRAVNVRREP